MDPNYEWRFENGAPVALTGAFGILPPEEISLERLTQSIKMLRKGLLNF